MAQGLFPIVSNEINFPRDEQKTLTFWRERRIFEKTIEARKASEQGTFVFYEGPPTANGLPHNGSVLTRVIKDLFPRYRTMRGYRVPRKAGWDTHGLPVEVEVEKELRIHGKAAIEAYGIEPFTARCIESVFRYTAEWERLTERIGFWVDLNDAYVTFHRSYVESEWWALKDLFEKGLLYRGHKVVWWWAQGGTALSSGEVGLGYKTVDDPSAYVAFPLHDDPEGHALLVWTTTPWTLPSNSYAAVHPDTEYAYVTLGERNVIVAAALVDAIAQKLQVQATITHTVKGKELVGKGYAPPFDLYIKQFGHQTPYFHVISADFVTLDTGTGIVHIAPAFGEDDFLAHQAMLAKLNPEQRDQVPLLCAVQPDGTFVPELTRYAGRWVKSCDREIADELKARGLLIHLEQYRHEYPFCWRSDSDPLIQYARPTWYIRTTSRIHEAIANNRQINWLPEHIKEGRFGDFLANNVDWALSRERFWGTPLPIWQNVNLLEDDPRRYMAIGSLAELRAAQGSNLAEVEHDLQRAIADPERAKHLLVHKPWVDRVSFERPGVPGRYHRVPDVIDCWFDSGCMPFAQWGFPHQEGSLERLREAFPADFISEGIDQTRGWFYTLLMVSTLVFDAEKQKAFGLQAGATYPHPYKTCMVLGHVADREGKKESKSKGNYTPPEVILDRVRMDFAVIDTQTALKAGVKAAPAQAGVALIAREDLEGLDLQDNAHVKVVRCDDDSGTCTLSLPVRALKGLPRRVVLLAPEDQQTLGVVVCSKGMDVIPVEVPRLPAVERVSLEDPTTPAPGADAFRWFFYASSPPWTSTRHSLTNVRALQKEFLIKLRNVFSFFTIYANIDSYSASFPAPPSAERPLLCRWVLSELALTVHQVQTHMDQYHVYEAAQSLTTFVEALSNWYVRRSRDRFWAPGSGADMGSDKLAAYATLHECLVTLALVSAPFVPFFAEELYQGLVVRPGVAGAKESVHLENYPNTDSALFDESLSIEMAAVRELVSLGLQVRTSSKLKVRQPLRRADVVLSRGELAERLTPHVSLIADELNVHEIRFLRPGEEGDAVRYKLKPNFRALGPKVGKKVQLVKQALERENPAMLRARLVTEGSITLSIDGEPLALSPDEIEISVEATEGFAAAGGSVGVVVLHTALDEELLDEGLAREVQSRLQALRKEMNLGFTERVLVSVQGSARIQRAVTKAETMLKSNVLIDMLEMDTLSFSPARTVAIEIEDEPVTLSLLPAVKS